MRITDTLCVAVRNALGPAIDRARIQDAFDSMEKDCTVEKARQQLADLEKRFKAARGRGVDLAEEIDNLRIFLVAHKHMPRDRELTLTVKLKAPDDLSQEQVAALVHRLIAIGLEDVGGKPDDFDDPQAEDALALEMLAVS